MQDGLIDDLLDLFLADLDLGLDVVDAAAGLDGVEERLRHDVTLARVGARRLDQVAHKGCRRFEHWMLP